MTSLRILVVAALGLFSCGSDSSTKSVPLFTPTLSAFGDGLVAGNPDGQCKIPSEALPASIVRPDRVVGTGTRSSCTAEAFRAAVAHGGIIVFDCGPDTITIVLDQPAKVFNDSLPDIVIDGGGKVALSGGGRTRILYMNTCDKAQHWTSPRCDNQPTPRLVVQNLSFVDGNAEAEGTGGTGGGGAIYASGGSLKVVNCRFYGNVCARTGADVGGGAIRAFQQYNQAPVQVVNSTFGAAGSGNVGSNGGALSSIMVNWNIYNSLFVGNQAVGNGGNPQKREPRGAAAEARSTTTGTR